MGQIPVSGRKFTASVLDTDLVANRAGLTPENESFGQILRIEDFAGIHVDLARNHRSDARTAMSFSARMWNVDSGIQHGVDQCLVPGPSKPVADTVQVDLHTGVDSRGACFSVCHDAILARGTAEVDARAQWAG